MSTQALHYLNPWHHSQQTLSFQLSDKTLLKTNLSMLMCELGLNNPPCDPADISVLPSADRDKKVDGFIAWGAHVNDQVKTLQVSDDLIVYIPEQYNRFYTRLDQSFDNYKKSFKSKTRSGIQRKVNKFAKLNGGKNDFRVYTTAEELQEFLTCATQLTRKTYQTKLLDAGLPEDEAYRRQLLKMAAENKVRAFLLFKENQPVSYLVLDAVGDTLVYRYLGYDPEESKTSPGTVLHWLALEYLTDHDQLNTSTLPKAKASKNAPLEPRVFYCANIYWLNKKLKNLALVYSQVALNRASAAIGNALDAVGIKARLKKILRGNG